MTICRSFHDKHNPYLIINPSIVKDNRISWKAKGLWLYAFSRPNDWKFYLSDLVKQSTDGRDSVYKGLHELEKHGYLFRHQQKDPKSGRYINLAWCFFETPKTPQEIQKMFPETDFPDPDSPIPENPTLLSNEDIPSTERREREGAAAPKPPARSSSSPSVTRRPNVQTTDDEHQKLVTEYGEDEVEQMYDVLQEWKEDTPRSKWKKSDYRSIRRWVVDALKEKAKRGETRKETGRVEDNRAYSQKIAHDFMLVKGPEKFVDIRADANCITFSSTHPTADRRTSILAYKENGFRDQLDALLRKWRLL